MPATLSLNANIHLNFKQLTELVRQLPKREKVKLVTFLEEDIEPIKTKAEIINDIKEALEEVKLHKAGKIKLRTLDEFLDEI